MDFTDVISYWSQPQEEGSKPPSSDDVVDAILMRVRAQHFIGQPQHIEDVCKRAQLSGDQINILITELDKGSKTIKTNIRSEYLQIAHALRTMLQ